MKTIRERFEEIWPVPEQIQWSQDRCAYWTDQYGFMLFAAELNLRLDTFTRCQETTAIYISLIEDLASSLGMYIDGDDCNEVEEGNEYWKAEQVLIRAKQVMERLK